MTNRIARLLVAAAAVAAVATLAAPADAATCYRIRTYQYVCLPSGS